ncbi:DNA repair protein RecO [Aquimarina agarilytica]|uniref:DNA repair protein RecO n=1 Tax=Aquimarina agarilytica TaxID=1087449 RepID=UPI00028A3054|nr:DNA repair protein RecO [Aquimarina agarilytica]
MLIKTEAIVVHSIRYGEADLIVKLYTKQKGVVSYLVRGVLKSRKGKLKPSLFLPFSILNIDANYKSNNSLQRIIDAKLITHFKTLHESILKGGLISFLAEILSNVLIENESDEGIYDFIKKSLLWLDSNDEVALFHVFFLLKLTHFLGCSPDISNIELNQFSLEEACFTVGDKSGYAIDGELLIAFKLLLGIKFDDLKGVSLPKSIRKQLLDKVLLYYSFHVPGFKKTKSLSVLEALFN